MSSYLVIIYRHYIALVWFAEHWKIQVIRGKWRQFNVSKAARKCFGTKGNKMTINKWECFKGKQTQFLKKH